MVWVVSFTRKGMSQCGNEFHTRLRYKAEDRETVNKFSLMSFVQKGWKQFDKSSVWDFGCHLYGFTEANEIKEANSGRNLLPLMIYDQRTHGLSLANFTLGQIHELELDILDLQELRRNLPWKADQFLCKINVWGNCSNKMFKGLVLIFIFFWRRALLVNTNSNNTGISIPTLVTMIFVCWS